MSMSSTNFNVGLLEGRNSSRVLKPPGGGHSQIFGGSGNEEDKPRPKMRHQNTSEINACFGQEEKTLNMNGSSIHEIKSDIVDTASEVQIMEVKPLEYVENSAPVTPVEEVKQSSGPSRVRVPPGGFSSGFW